MSQGDWQLAQGDALTRLLFSTIKAERFAEFYTGEGAQPGVSESFCRSVFRQSAAQRTIDADRVLPCREIALADEQNAITFFEFSPLPFHLQRWLRVDLFAPRAGEYPFRLGVSGGVRIWREEQLLACFTPHLRNRMPQREVALPLAAGRNGLLIHLDALAERDTRWGLQIVYLGEPPLGAALPGEKALPVYQCLSQPPVVSQNNACAARLLALMRQRQYGPGAGGLLQGALSHISAREECSAFSLLPLLALWHFHQGDYFQPALWRRVRSTLLGYRYWQDERGCDAMCFDSENHALAFHAAQYLAGQFFPDALFIASGRRGRQQQAIARERLERWFARVEASGFAERNETQYYPTDYRGLAALAEMADDQTLRERAAKLAQRATA